MDNKDIKKQALEYHEFPVPGKIGIQILKPTESQNDLALAYTPGVAEPVLKIVESPLDVYRYTIKKNLIAIITNGTAVLGCGNVGPLAAKPVMEGKSVLFKRYANVDAFDIEVDESDPKALIKLIQQISPTFGGINLEDIKAPECFEIEKELSKILDIPVFHDDQHGTAIVAASGLLNALELAGKKLDQIKIVCMGAGAAGIASMQLLKDLGADINNLILLDSKGVIHSERDDINIYKRPFAHKTNMRTLDDAMKDADVFIGVSKADVLSVENLKSMSANPIVFALSNPNPEIRPEIAHIARQDLILATGRSDYPNQVNNVLCFPYIFRGALDAGATKINQAMCIAAVEAIRAIVREPVVNEVKSAYPKVSHWEFGREYIIPKPMDPRLCERVPKAVAQAAALTGCLRK